MRIVSTLLASKPGSTLRRATSVRISSADPTSSSSASATSTTTRIERALFWRKPVPERPPLSLSVVREIGPRALQRRDQAEDNAGADRDSAP